MAPKFKFAEGEKVLCFHGPLIYEAKCLKSNLNKEKQIKYLIHYAGWNKNWDEWVPESRVLKYNDVNVQKQKEVQKAHSTQSAKAKKAAKPKKESKDKEEKEGTTSRSSTPSVDSNVATPASRTRKVATPQPTQESTDVSRKKRMRVDAGVESEEQFTSKVEIKIKIPDELQPWLVDDWDAIYRQRKIFSLPAKHTVASIIDNYVQYKQSSKSHNQHKESALSQVATGILDYFNVLLGSQLLYKFERPQYAEILQKHPNTKMSSIYGPIHLLRLFVRLGAMIAFTQLDEKSVSTLLIHIQDFLKYLVKNSTTLFNMEDFVNPSPDYHRKIQSV